MNLTDELPRMSWRQITVLLDGLHPYCALASHYESAMKKQREDETREATGPTAAVNRFWGRIASIRPMGKE